MTLFERIAENAVRIAAELSESAGLCSFMMCFFALAAMVCIRGIVSGLLGMHRGKSALKKILKTYSFGQKICLKHVWQECLHAKKFCRILIVSHHCIFGLLLVELLLSLMSIAFPVLLSVVAWFTLVFTVVVSLPMCLLNLALDRYPLQKWKHEFRFRKYHNTSDHNSLW